MVFRVEIVPSALRNLDAIFLSLKRKDPNYAERWLVGIINAILSLEKLPTRCSKAVESHEIGQEVRILLYGKRHQIYKIFFSIHSSIVQVFHVRPGLMKPPDIEELQKTIKIQ